MDRIPYTNLRDIKIGNKVRFKTREELRKMAASVVETYNDDKLVRFDYKLPSGIYFSSNMEHLCGITATITNRDRDAYQNYYILKLSDFKPFNKNEDYDWIYTSEMVELVEDKPKSEPKSEQKSSESLDELRDKLENLKPKRKAVDIEIKCLKKMYNDYVKDYEEACNDFREFSEYAEQCLEGMKECILEAEKEVADDESLK